MDNPSKFTFDELLELYERSPSEYERRRREIINHELQILKNKNIEIFNQVVQPEQDKIEIKRKYLEPMQLLEGISADMCTRLGIMVQCYDELGKQAREQERVQERLDNKLVELKNNFEEISKTTGKIK